MQTPAPDKKVYEWSEKMSIEASCPTCIQIKRDYNGFGPWHFGSASCKSGSLASGGKESHCTCDICF